MARGGFERWFLRLADPEGRHEAREWPAGLDVHGFCRFADWHGVLPALVRNAERSAAEEAAGASRAGIELLREVADEILRPRIGLCMLLRKRLGAIETAFADKNIPAVVIKGRTFADRLYPDPALRPFTDLDFLLPREAFDAAGGVLTALGYRRASQSGGKYPGKYAEETWRREDAADWAVELHWNLVNSPPLRRRCSVAFGDLARDTAAPPRLSSSSLLLVAAVHAAMSHRFDRLQPLCDVLQAARGTAGPLDAESLRDTASRTGSRLALATALDLAAAAFEEPACRDLADSLMPVRGSCLARHLITPTTVVHSRRALAGIRRQLFRELLKRMCG